MQLRSAIENAESFSEPYEYFVISDWASDEDYAEMIENLPDFSKYERYNDKYKNRYLYDMSDKFWKSVKRKFEFEFGDNIRVQMCRDLPGYSIGPHTDGKREYSTILFYLTPTAEPVGTNVYVPKDKSFTHNGKTHLEFKDFEKVKQAEYAPNKAFGFIRSDKSFHGVEPCDIERNLIQVSIWN